jgi:hypothetical protein
VHGLQGAGKKNLAARDAAVLASNPKQALGRRKPPPRGGLAAQGARSLLMQILEHIMSLLYADHAHKHGSLVVQESSAESAGPAQRMST